MLLQVDDLGGLMAVAVANASAIEARRGALGLANWAGARLMAAAHRRQGKELTGRDMCANSPTSLNPLCGVETVILGHCVQLPNHISSKRLCYRYGRRQQPVVALL